MIRLQHILERVNPRGIEVRPVSGDEESNTFDAMARKHYLGGVNKNINIKLGIFMNDTMIGMAAYGPPTAVSIAQKLNLNSGEVFELRRFYTEKNYTHNLESQALSMANDVLKELRPQTKVIVTYADPQQGHLGKLYQATNAIYLGKGIGAGGKHKYIYLVGSKSDRRNTANRIKYDKKDYPKEELKEFEAEGFDLDEFLNIRSFAGKVRYANNKLKRMASGSARIIYDIDGKTVLKLAKNPKGIAQNEVEASLGTDYYVGDLVAKVLEEDDKHRWIVMEKAKKITKNRFKELTGVALDKFYYYIRNEVGNSRLFNVSPEDEEELRENEFVIDIIDLCHNYDLETGDFGRPSSFGEIEGRLVITDYGLTKEVFRKHYAWDRKKRNQYD